jgi:hypothetical protein
MGLRITIDNCIHSAGVTIALLQMLHSSKPLNTSGKDCIILSLMEVLLLFRCSFFTTELELCGTAMRVAQPISVKLPLPPKLRSLYLLLLMLATKASANDCIVLSVMDFFPGSALSMLIIRDSHPPCFIYINKFIITNDGNFFSHTSGCDTPSIIFPPKLNGYFLHSADRTHPYNKSRVGHARHGAQ